MVKSILITGAGSGIGRSIAFELSKREGDFHLFLFGRNRENLEETGKGLKCSYSLIQASQTDKKELKSILKEAKLEEKNLTSVIANAGVAGGNTYGDDDRWDDIIGTNLSGTYYLIQECLPFLLASKEKYKHVVVMSSILARLGLPGYTAYCASKAGLLGLTRSLAASYAKKGLLVNAVCPGWVETSMGKEGIEDFAKLTGKDYKTAYNIQMSSVPTRKMAEPSEIASLVAYLTSSSQGSITGQSFDINNGALMV